MWSLKEKMEFVILWSLSKVLYSGKGLATHPQPSRNLPGLIPGFSNMNCGLYPKICTLFQRSHQPVLFPETGLTQVNSIPLEVRSSSLSSVVGQMAHSIGGFCRTFSCSNSLPPLCLKRRQILGPYTFSDSLARRFFEFLLLQSSEIPEGSHSNSSSAEPYS